MPVCPICPKQCKLQEGQTGFCHARACINGVIVPINYGKITSIALDPIEKKPLYHFFPKSHILSVGSFGCNLRCPFCQNYQISMANMQTAAYRTIAPYELVDLALKLAHQPLGNIGVAFTYNEPFISYEYVRDCAILLHQAGLKTVLVTNGHINLPPLQDLLPLIDAMNIDLKGFTQEYYDYVGGNLECVKQTIAAAYDKCHVEVTTLIVPTKNDRADDMEKQAKWLASLSAEIPLHISRYFPRYKSTIAMTPIEKMYELQMVAQKYLHNVHLGNC
ncbi:MAG: AmmeMemoRadiSam system radical SAM enzyme [Alphaproteobacteria bacterium]|nr:AmmeMemoRadiSam system radical SAM enzyme [Alphaproteobacteria bacterium]